VTSKRTLEVNSPDRHVLRGTAGLENDGVLRNNGLRFLSQMAPFSASVLTHILSEYQRSPRRHAI
jgi:hypothetical protein